MLESLFCKRGNTFLKHSKPDIVGKKIFAVRMFVHLLKIASCRILKQELYY